MMLAVHAFMLAPTQGWAEDLAQRFAPSVAASSATVDHTAWDKLLKSYVRTAADGVNRVDYAAFKMSGHTALKSYIAEITRVDVATLNKAEQFAIWANLYNAMTVDVVLDAYPVSSIKDIRLGGGLVATITGGPWKSKIVTVSGVPLSLDDIEHQIMRPVFRDARVHYAVNCASIGCPNLATEAFTGAALEKQLDAAARAFVNHPRGFQHSDGAIVASSIYDWFVADFGGSAAGVVAHARRYAEPKLKAALQAAAGIESYDYNWSLNDVAR